MVNPSRSIFLLSLFLVILGSCKSQVEDIKESSDKINGISFVASRGQVDLSHVNPIININANYASVMPLGFMRELESPEVVYNNDRQWYGERIEGARQSIQLLHGAGIKVMLKPQIWIWRGAFTGDLLMTSEADWITFETSYESFILLFAKLAQETQTDMFCIGTELYNFVNARPEFWNNLIKKVKTVYSGKLTYAENWDKVDKVDFWRDLDYIGVDAYFPISEQKTPTLEDAKKGWQTWKAELENLNKSQERPILFTEYGYRSIDYSGKEPWQSNQANGLHNMDAQYNLTKAVFEEFWNEPWFAGGFIWKWHHNHDQVGGLDNNRFTPQNKPVEKLLKEQYGLHKQMKRR